VETLVRKIIVELHTDSDEGASTKGQVFLGLGGREFRLDIKGHDDFDQNEEAIYELGEGSNVLNSARNDPRTGMPVTIEAVTTFPAYIRLAPRKDSDDWKLALVKVVAIGGDHEVRFAALDATNEDLWLGPQSGNCLYLRRRT
jgi:hypothetical protein